MSRPLEFLQACTVGIAGAGGLGSNCAAALARSGVGRLVIADFDRVSRENLNRQAFFCDQVGMKKVDALKENIQRMAPQTEVAALDLRLTEENVLSVFSACPVVVEAFDSAEAKQMIVETFLTERPRIWLVAASGLGGYGRNEILHTRRSGRLIICGDEGSEVSPELPPLAPRVGIVAHMQANVVLELLLDEPSLARQSAKEQK
ncbi:MAG TPA: sulfur carrier protein ThiS adenylyltransferase ThiF [Candidatus Aminicenantes bacterium]|nr:sulfur carrier protein ThiS adenylyltransferase ThiF [Candidatus Aminicenantes bacterium]